MSTPGTERWRPTRTSLAYRLAVFTLCYWRFDALAYDRHFTEIKTDDALNELPDNDRGCYIFPSYPITQSPKALRIDQRRLIYTPKVFPNYFVDLKLQGGFEGYLAGFSSKTRSTLKRKLRKLSDISANGSLDFRVYRNATELSTFIDIAARISERTYQTRLLDCGLPTGSDFRQNVLELADQGKAYGFLLFIENKPAAYVYSQRRNGVVTYDYVGHDPIFNAQSPGTVLQYQLLEYLFNDVDARIFDFTEGEGAHKALFATGKLLCAKSIVFPREIKPTILVCCHALVERANKLIDVLADRLALRQTLRRLIRRSLPGAENAQ